MRLQFALVAQKYMRVMQQKAAQDAAGGLQVGVNFEALMSGQKAVQEETARVFELENGDDFHHFLIACSSGYEMRTDRAFRMNMIQEFGAILRSKLSISPRIVAMSGPRP